jgi:hypothetical protein
MSFREKSAWVTLISLIVVTLLFFLHIPHPYTLRPPPSPFIFHVVMLLIVTFVVIEVVAHVVIAIRSPRDARTPKDERERLIEIRSTAIGAYVYAFLSLGSIFVTIHLGANEIAIAYLVLFSFVVAEIVNYALRVIYYRRGF